MTLAKAKTAAEQIALNVLAQLMILSPGVINARKNIA
jgi:hypothetical protein